MTNNLNKTSIHLERGRLLSLDALRGFDMLWIIGVNSLIFTLAKLTGFGWLISVAAQMDHVPWSGFHFFDLIFPLFMFVSGVVIPIALLPKIEKGVLKKDLILKALKRMIILIVLGLLYNKAFEHWFDDMRFASVLGQIGIAYFLTTLIIINTRSTKIRIVWLVGIMASVAFIQLFIPVPGIGAGVLTPEGCINGFIDRMLLPGRLYDKVIDPEGLLCIVSATAITLMGSLVGYFLCVKQFTDWQKIKYMSITGICLISIALSISPYYPIIKNCWTSSFVLLTGGISILFLTLFYLLFDVIKWHRGAFFFRVIGMNSIFIYLLIKIIDFQNLAKLFLGWTSSALGDSFQLTEVAGAVVLEWLLLYYMYRKNIFIKV